MQLLEVTGNYNIADLIRALPFDNTFKDDFINELVKRNPKAKIDIEELRNDVANNRTYNLQPGQTYRLPDLDDETIYKNIDFADHGNATRVSPGPVVEVAAIMMMQKEYDQEVFEFLQDKYFLQTDSTNQAIKEFKPDIGKELTQYINHLTQDEMIELAGLGQSDSGVAMRQLDTALKRFNEYGIDVEGKTSAGKSMLEDRNEFARNLRVYDVPEMGKTSEGGLAFHVSSETASNVLELFSQDDSESVIDRLKGIGYVTNDPVSITETSKKSLLNAVNQMEVPANHSVQQEIDKFLIDVDAEDAARLFNQKVTESTQLHEPVSAYQRDGRKDYLTHGDHPRDYFLDDNGHRISVEDMQTQLRDVGFEIDEEGFGPKTKAATFLVQNRIANAIGLSGSDYDEYIDGAWGPNTQRDFVNLYRGRGQEFFQDVAKEFNERYSSALPTAAEPAVVAPAPASATPTVGNLLKRDDKATDVMVGHDGERVSVNQLQKQLREVGFKIEETGEFDKDTEKAVRLAQAAIAGKVDRYGLEYNIGQWGPDTQAEFLYWAEKRPEIFEDVAIKFNKAQAETRGETYKVSDERIQKTIDLTAEKMEAIRRTPTGIYGPYVNGPSDVYDTVKNSLRDGTLVLGVGSKNFIEETVSFDLSKESPEEVSDKLAKLHMSGKYLRVLEDDMAGLTPEAVVAEEAARKALASAEKSEAAELRAKEQLQKIQDAYDKRYPNQLKDKDINFIVKAVNADQKFDIPRDMIEQLRDGEVTVKVRDEVFVIHHDAENKGAVIDRVNHVMDLAEKQRSSIEVLPDLPKNMFGDKDKEAVKRRDMNDIVTEVNKDRGYFGRMPEKLIKELEDGELNLLVGGDQAVPIRFTGNNNDEVIDQVKAVMDSGEDIAILPDAPNNTPNMNEESDRKR